MHDYYQILGIERNASTEEIKRAYRNKAKEFHPDVNKLPDAAEIFILLNEAHAILTDDHKRHLYDIKLQYGSKQIFGKYFKNPTQPNYNYARNTKHHRHFHYDWESINKARQKRDKETLKPRPVVYNLFFASGMFSGFLIVCVTINGIYLGYWPKFYIAVVIPGIILIKEGWKGIIGKRTIYRKILTTIGRWLS